jgi:SH3-like domain-containing protein
MSTDIASNGFSSKRRPVAFCAAAAVRLAAVCLLAMSIAAEVARAAGGTGLPLPRFVSLRKDEVNLRTGPGTRYPIEWVLTYRNMPVEVTAEFEAWRKVRDWKGTVGWVHKSMLSGKRWVIVRGQRRPLRRNDDVNAPVIAHLDERVIGRLEQCRRSRCRIDIAGIQGWIERSAVWGVYPDEKVR